MEKVGSGKRGEQSHSMQSVMEWAKNTVSPSTVELLTHVCSQQNPSQQVVGKMAVKDKEEDVYTNFQ